MLKINCCLIFLSILFVLPLFSQEIEDENTVPESRNDFQIYGGAGFGIYSLKSNESKANNSLTTTSIYTIGAFYSINNNFYFGISYNRLSFATNQDSTQSAHVNNLGLLLKYNVQKTEKSSIHFNLNLGTTSLKYFDNKINANVNASSLFLEPGIGFDHFWGNHLGYFLNASYYYTRYNKIVNKDNHPLKIINNGFEEQLWIALMGMHLKLGLIYKF